MNRRLNDDERNREFFVGRFRVRPMEGLVENGVRTRHVEPQVMALLEYLANNSRRVVSREELLREVWGGTAVTDGAITRCIGVIRRLLDAQDAGDPIRTVPKRGYQLIADVRSAPEVTEKTPTVRRRAMFAAAVLLMSVASAGLWFALAPFEPEPVTVVVEVFEDLDDLARHEQWGRSVTEELTAGIYSMPGMTLVTGEGHRAAEGVVLTGSVRREGDTARVYTQLTDVRSQVVLNASTCTIPSQPRLEIQEQWASAIVKRVGAASARVRSIEARQR